MSKLESYILQFNAEDEECYKNDIDNAHALEWLKEEIPMLECPDEDIERTYYFRWWIYRKHIKSTQEGSMITEFLPEVPWSGKYNLINAAVGHHIVEGRWLKHAGRYLKDYINFFLDNRKDGMRYSSWLIWAAREFYNVTPDLDLPDFLKKAVPYYRAWEKERRTDCGLFWSWDNYDAMEFSISGTRDGKSIKGLRPTLNSYMYGDAAAIYDLSLRCGKPLEEFKDKAESIRSKMQSILFRDGFYKALHPKNEDFSDMESFRTDDIPRELIGYIPWYFGIPEKGQESVFKLLEDKEVFATEFGITTAEQGHPGFLYPSEHECLWNGYIWPFATSQVLTGIIRAAEDEEVQKAYGELFFRLLRQYAKQHTRTADNGKKLMWIDEAKAPFEDSWSCREVLKEWGWRKDKGGYERGKDYNHSTFCDLVISGLAGVCPQENGITFRPMIPKEWEYFAMDHLYICGDCYRIEYDKTGEKYGKCGWNVYKNGAEMQTGIRTF